jgi:peptidoglycan/LPS O-acetylase OafA/YrhL
MEEQFYLLWPILLFVMLRMKLAPRTIVIAVCVGIFASGVWRFLLYRSLPAPGPLRDLAVHRLYMGLDTRADSLLAGCLVGLLAGWNWLPNSRHALGWLRMAAVVSAATLGFVFVRRTFDHHQCYYGLFMVVALAIAIVIVQLLSDPPRVATRILESSPLVGAGRISYALYLYHMPILRWLRPAGLGWHYPTDTLLAAALSFAAAIASYYGVERPCLRLKNRLRSTRAALPKQDPTGVFMATKSAA